MYHPHFRTPNGFKEGHKVINIHSNKVLDSLVTSKQRPIFMILGAWEGNPRLELLRHGVSGDHKCAVGNH